MFEQYTTQVNIDNVIVNNTNTLSDKQVSAITDYSNFVNEYNEHNSITKQTTSHIETLLESYTSLFIIKENINQYGLTDQFKAFIAPDLKGTTLEYALTTSNVSELTVGIEGMLETLKTKIINAINYLYKKVMEFIEWIATSAVVLRERIAFAFNRYSELDPRKDITKVPHYGVWAQDTMVNIVRKTREFKYKLDSIKIDNNDKFNYVVPFELEEFYTELKDFTTEINNLTNTPKHKRLGDAGFRTIKIVQNRQLANVAYDAVTNIIAFRNIYNKLFTTIKVLEKRIKKSGDETRENLERLSNSVTKLKDYYNVCKALIDLNVAVITQYCSLLKHYNSYINGNYPDAVDEVQQAPAQQ